jgi:hypothetical protein
MCEHGFRPILYRLRKNGSYPTRMERSLLGEWVGVMKFLRKWRDRWQSISSSRRLSYGTGGRWIRSLYCSIGFFGTTEKMHRSDCFAAISPTKAAGTAFTS